MRSAVRQLITGVAVAVALSAVGVGAIGGAIAQSPQRTPALAQDGLVSGYNAAPFDVGGPARRSPAAPALFSRRVA